VIISIMAEGQRAGPDRPAGHLPVLPCELPDGIELVFADDRGRRVTVDLGQADKALRGPVSRYREPPAYRGQRNFPGWWWSATTGSHVVYESWLERHHIIEADRDPRVTAITGRPFALTWPGEKRNRRHIPDLFCRLLGGGAVVTDCRPVGRADDDFRYKCAVTAAACEVIGWQYRVAGEPDPVWAANLRWMAGYRHPRFADPPLEEQLLDAFAEPGPLAEVAGRAGDPICVLPVVFHLMWRGSLTGDLGRPLGVRTVLVAADPLETA
jgi:hypothetical protein